MGAAIPAYPAASERALKQLLSRCRYRRLRFTLSLSLKRSVFGRHYFTNQVATLLPPTTCCACTTRSRRKSWRQHGGAFCSRMPRCRRHAASVCRKRHGSPAHQRVSCTHANPGQPRPTPGAVGPALLLRSRFSDSQRSQQKCVMATTPPGGESVFP